MFDDQISCYGCQESVNGDMKVIVNENPIDETELSDDSDSTWENQVNASDSDLEFLDDEDDDMDDEIDEELAQALNDEFNHDLEHEMEVTSDDINIHIGKKNKKEMKNNNKNKNNKNKNKNKNKKYGQRIEAKYEINKKNGRNKRNRRNHNFSKNAKNKKYKIVRNKNNNNQNKPISERLKRKIQHENKQQRKKKRDQKRLENNKLKVQEVKEAKIMALIRSKEKLNEENTKFIGDETDIKWACVTRIGLEFEHLRVNKVKERMEVLVNTLDLDKLFDLANDQELMDKLAKQYINGDKKMEKKQDDQYQGVAGIGPDGIGIYTSTKMGDSPIVETGDELESENENGNENVDGNNNVNESNGRNGNESGNASGDGIIVNENSGEKAIIQNVAGSGSDVVGNNGNARGKENQNIHGKNDEMENNNNENNNDGNNNELAAQVGMLQQQMLK